MADWSESRVLPQNAPQRNCPGHLAHSDNGVSTLTGPAWLSALCKGLSPQVSNPGPGSADIIWGNPLQAQSVSQLFYLQNGDEGSICGTLRDQLRKNAK